MDIKAWQRKDAFRRKNLLDRSSERYGCDVVSVEVYPIRYVNLTDLPRVEKWNSYKTARSCDPPTVCKFETCSPDCEKPIKDCDILYINCFGIAETL